MMITKNDKWAWHMDNVADYPCGQQFLTGNATWSNITLYFTQSLSGLTGNFMNKLQYGYWGKRTV